MVIASLVSVVVSCATYQDSTPSTPLDSGGAAGDGASSGSAGLPISAGGSHSTAGAPNAIAGSDPGGALGDGFSGSSSGGLPGSGAGTSGSGMGGKGGTTNGGGSAGASAGAGNTGSGGRGGSQGLAGASNNAGTGMGGSGGSADPGGSAGSAGSPAVDRVLSLSKSAFADSSQSTSKESHPPNLGNDGMPGTRWCAADGATGHYWQVNLGGISTLSKLDLNWEKAALYKFKVEGSTDGNTWSMLLDQQNSTNSAQIQSYALSGAPSASWVRLTVTSLPASTIWASFNELTVWGH